MMTEIPPVVYLFFSTRYALAMNEPIDALPSSARETYAILRKAYPGNWNLSLLRPYICPFEHILPHVPTHAEILEVGCGHGYVSSLIAATRNPTHITGIDVSPGAIETAKLSAYATQGVASFEVMEAFRFPQKEYDAVLCVDVLHHVPPLEQEYFLQEMANTVRSGGILIVKDMAPTPRLCATMNTLHDFVVARQLPHYRDVSEVKRWLDTSFELLIEEPRIFRFWYSHYLLVWRKK